MDCNTCKKHYSQGGKCTENKKNCLYYEEKPRGKMVRMALSFYLNDSAETPIIKYGSKVIFDDGEKRVELTVIKINWINLETMVCNIDAEYHENEEPYFAKKRKFKIVK